MTGMLFYWFSWILWIIVTFFMKKGRVRTLLACWILLVLIFADAYIIINEHDLSLGFVWIFFGALIWLLQLPRVTYHIFASFTLTIGYTGMLYWAQASPVWLFLPRTFLLSFLLSLILFLLAKEFISQAGIGLFGVCCGEIVYALTLSSYGFPEAVGEMAFLDNLLAVMIIIGAIDILQKGRKRVTIASQLPKTPMEVAK
ncbi:hypothetical protein [Lentibacillus sediminis]|uniref:YphA family membrane protein n=1 Tax=Lentibacillus sediminis TaxID=1940529 RepID=UPI000C1C14BF|nr:hypothetical protein [Lentibacillus sediminis]